MADPKSMERLVARFESNRDQHSVHLLYCSWCDEHEPLSADDLPEAWKRHRPIFRVETEDGFEGLIIVASKDALAKSKVLETCRTAAQTFHNDLENHGFEPDPGFEHPEANWLKALVSAAMDDKLGFEGFNDNEGSIRFDGDSAAPTDSTISSDEIEWCDKGLLPRSFMPMRNIAEASLVLMDRLQQKPETKPEQKGTSTTKLKALWETKEGRAFLMLATLEQIAERVGVKAKSTISENKWFKKNVLPHRENIGTDGKKLKRIKNKIDRQEAVSESDERLYRAYEEITAMELT